jgi:hypothetical protein
MAPRAARRGATPAEPRAPRPAATRSEGIATAKARPGEPRSRVSFCASVTSIPAKARPRQKKAASVESGAHARAGGAAARDDERARREGEQEARGEHRAADGEAGDAVAARAVVARGEAPPAVEVEEERAVVGGGEDVVGIGVHERREAGRSSRAAAVKFSQTQERQSRLRAGDRGARATSAVVNGWPFTMSVAQARPRRARRWAAGSVAPRRASASRAVRKRRSVSRGGSNSQREKVIRPRGVSRFEVGT